MSWQSSESDRPAPDGHVPVLVGEVLRLLDCSENRNYLDLTLGGGGHAEAILKATGPSGNLAGSDRDPAALARTGARLKLFGDRARLFHGTVGGCAETIRACGLRRIDGALIDCGVSSYQLDDPERGFSFRHSGPLDMRMDPTDGKTAQAWLAGVSEKELADTIFQYGEDRFSRRIARAIVAVRRGKKIKTTQELAEIVRAAVPASKRSHTIDPATRTFQAIRIAVNNELQELKKGIESLLELLPPKARIAVISFQSLEDRIVKTLFRAAEKEQKGRILTKKPLRPSEEEMETNPRSRSAKLRGIEIAGEAS